MNREEPPIFPKTYSLARDVFEFSMRFPKSQRFVIASRLQNAVLDLLEGITKAYAVRQKADSLQSAAAALDRLRILLRLAQDLKFVSIKKGLLLHAQADEVGRMLGGWLKQAGQNRRASKTASV